MLSRRGLLPQVHDLRSTARTPASFSNRGNLRLLFRELRGHLDAARQVIDELRSESNSIGHELRRLTGRDFCGI
jgi:hypothetical protein